MHIYYEGEMQVASKMSWWELEGGHSVAGSAALDDAGSVAGLPLVLLPGTLCDRRVFDPLIERLGARKVITLEMTGARDANALAVQLLAATPKRFALLGFSLGGIIALEMAALAPDRIAGLALLNTNPRHVAPDDHELRRGQAKLAKRLGLGAYVSELLWPSYAVTRAADPNELHRLIVNMAQTLGQGVFEDQIEVAISRLDSRIRLSQITVPTLILSGELDAICTLDMQNEMAEALPNAKLIIVDGAGHLAVLEAAEVVASHVRDWLAVIDLAALRTNNTTHANAGT